MKTYMKVHLDILEKNYRAQADALPPGSSIMAVVKADAYGLGAVPVAEKLSQLGCRSFAVTFLEEAEALRKAGIKGQILAMMPAGPDELKQACEYDIVVTVKSPDHARLLSEAAISGGLRPKAHIKLDCGLGRMGIVLWDREDEALKEALQILRMNGLRVQGIYTHITSAGDSEEGKRLDLRELELFSSMCGRLEKEGIHLQRHCLSSDPWARYPEYAFDAIRIGTCLYLRNHAVSLKSEIVQLKILQEGVPVGYGPAFYTNRRTKAAVVPIGFADGIRRKLSNQGEMIVRGQRAPIIGKICCDHTILDVTDVQGVKEGDEVTIFGTDGSESQDIIDYARLCGASEPEITSVLSRRITRKYESNETYQGEKYGE